MIGFIIAMAAQAAAPSDDARLKECLAAVRADPEKGDAIAAEWRAKGGGFAARQCLGLAHVALERWAMAAAEFEQAAREAEKVNDSRRADYWVQAGNSWLAANDPEKAANALDAAFATGLLIPEMKGEALFDRARAAVALGKIIPARADIDEGLRLVPADPFGWYLSSALAVKEGDLSRAQDDIAEAVRLAPKDADILVHAGNVAALSDEPEAARGLYIKAIKANPQSPAAMKARAALSGAEPREKQDR